VLSAKNFRDFLDAPPYKWPLNLLIHKGIFPAHEFTKWIDSLLASKLDSPVRVTLGQLPHRVTIYATRRDTGALVFDSMTSRDVPAAHAVRCSMAIPFIFMPQMDSGMRVLDGGVRNNYPVAALLSDHPHCDFIGLYLGPEHFEGIGANNSLLSDLVSIWSEATDVEALKAHREKTVVIDPRPISTVDFDLTGEEKQFLLKTGALAAAKFLHKRELSSSLSSVARGSRLKAGASAEQDADEPGAAHEGEATALKQFRADVAQSKTAITEKRRRRKRHRLRSVAGLAALILLLTFTYIHRAKLSLRMNMAFGTAVARDADPPRPVAPEENLIPSTARVELPDAARTVAAPQPEGATTEPARRLSVLIYERGNSPDPTVQSIVVSSLFNTLSQVSASDPSLKWLSEIEVERTESQRPRSIADLEHRRQEANAIALIYGFVKPGETIHSDIFCGSLRGSFPQELLSISTQETPGGFLPLRDAHSAVVLYLLAMEAKRNGKPSRSVRACLAEAFSICEDIEKGGAKDRFPNFPRFRAALASELAQLH